MRAESDREGGGGEAARISSCAPSSHTEPRGAAGGAHAAPDPAGRMGSKERRARSSEEDERRVAAKRQRVADATHAGSAADLQAGSMQAVAAAATAAIRDPNELELDGEDL